MDNGKLRLDNYMEFEGQLKEEVRLDVMIDKSWGRVKVNG